MFRVLPALATLVGLVLLVSPASAQATRTWVSGVGDDVNPCSRTAPCKTFAGAISKTAAGGEISVLDPGGFGSVTITKSISIVADGSEGGVVAANSNGIIINAGPGDVVHIRGLIIEGAGNGLNGVKVLSAAAVDIEHVVIRGFRGAGEGNAVRVSGAVNVTVIDSTLADNRAGVLADGPKAQVWIAGSTITGNGVAMQGGGGAQVHSYGDNLIHANGSDGAGWTKAPRR